MTSAPPSAFGALLRRHRVAIRLTQAELAERAGISQRGLVALENGERLRPHRDTVQLLAAALHLGDDVRVHFEAVARGRGPASCAGGDGALTDIETGVSELTLTPLVGRARELDILERHFTGPGPPVLVFAGEPGIGKTRLLRQAAELADRSGRAVIIGGCRRRSGQEPYAPVPHAIARYLASLPAATREELVRESRWLVYLLPELTPLLSEPLPSTSLQSGQERRLLFDSIARLLANLARGKGTVLLLDDLQWAPVDALDLLSALVQEPEGSHLRIVCAYRNTDVSPAHPLAVLLADLAHAGRVRQLGIEALSPREAEQLLARTTGDLSPPTEVVQQAVARTGGVPFFVVSYAHQLRTNGAAPATGLPWDVAHSILQRVGALPKESQDILAVAAVAGRVVSRAVIERAIGGKDVQSLSAIEIARRSRLLEEAGDGAYRFPHDIIRETIEADLGTARRIRLHRQVGEALEGLTSYMRAEGAAELAWHFLEGADPERALRYSLVAGDMAAAMFAHEEAEKHYRTAADLARAFERQPVQIETLLKLGMVLNNVGRLDEALAVLEEAAGYCSAASQPAAEARIVAQIGRVHERRGAIEEGITRLEPLLHYFDDTKDVDGMHGPVVVDLLLALGDLYYEAGRYPEELRAAERAVGLARLIGRDLAITDGERQRGLALISLGRRDQAMDVWAEALPLMEATGDLYNLSHTLNNLSAGCSDSQHATAYVERALEVAERLGDPSQIAFMTMNLASLHYDAGRWHVARLLAERSWNLSAPRRLLVSGYPALLLADIDQAEGEVMASRRWAETCIAIAKDSDLQATRLAQQRLAELDLQAKHPDLALIRLEPLLDRPGLEEEGVTLMLPTLARAYLEQGDMPRAEAIAQAGLRRAVLLENQPLIAELLLLQAVIAARGVRWEEAGPSFDEALRVAGCWPYPYAEGRILYEYGVMENRLGQLERARELLNEALLIFRRLGARPYQQRTETALGALSPG